MENCINNIEFYKIFHRENMRSISKSKGLDVPINGIKSVFEDFLNFQFVLSKIS